MTNHTNHSDCDNHARQASVVDPETNEARWVCEDCGADCGEHATVR